MQLDTFHDAGQPQPSGANGTQHTLATHNTHVPVVGLGASAGGLRALQQFFAHMPSTSGMAFVVILHLSPEHQSHAAAILQHATAMPVIQVTEPVRVEPNTVYVIPPAKHLAMQDGMIGLSEPDRSGGRQVAIDLFFRTLAETHTTHAACIVLSGTGADGSVSIKRVKETGGITIAQEPGDAEYDSMPRNAINTGMIDWVLPVAEMPERLIALWQNSDHIALPPEAEAAVVNPSQAAENALRTSEERLRLLIESATDYAIFSLDTERRVTSWSTGAQRIFGYTEHDIIGQSGDIVFTPDDRERGAPEREADTARDEGRAGNERWHLRKDGTQFYGSGTVRPLLDGAGTLRGFVKIMRDLTEQQRAEEALRASEARQAFLLHLGDALRPLVDPIAIQGEAARGLGEHLGVDRAYYAEIDEPAECFVVQRDHVRAGTPSVAGTYPIAQVPVLAGALRTGGPFVIADIGTTTLIPPAERAYLESLDVRAMAAIPLVKQGRFVAALAVAQVLPRQWTPDEIALIAEVAERTWDAVERARAEAASRASEEKYRTLFNSIDEGFCTIEVLFTEHNTPIDYRFLEINSAFEQMTGLRNAVGKTARELVPALEGFWIETYGRVALTGETVHFENRSEPMQRWFNVYASRAGGETSRQVAIVFTNITERKQAEEAVRESEERLRALLAKGADMITVSDRDGTIVYASPSTERVAGYTADEFLGSNPFATSIHPDDVGHCRDAMERLFATPGLSLSIEHRARHKDGTWHWFEGTFTSLFYDPAVGGLVANVRDITERKASEEELVRLYAAEQAARVEAEAALQTRDQFLSIASHELRTPLTSLIGYASMLVRATRGTGDIAKMTDRINRQAQRLNGLIEQLMDVSRLQRGQFAIECHPVDMAALAAQVVDETRATVLPGAAHTIELVRPSEPVVIEGDAQRLEQVLQNLLSNAMKYSPEGGPVHVRIMHTTTEAILEVVDHGIGIPQDAQAHLFEAFYRAPNVGAQASGFGLGLHVVQEIVQRHGGHIALQSLEGQGSTFRVVLPLQSGENAREHVTASDPS